MRDNPVDPAVRDVYDQFRKDEASTNSCTTSCSRMKIVKSSYCDGLLEIFSLRSRAASNDSGFRQQNTSRKPSLTRRFSSQLKSYRLSA